jgi:hypothetical protein
MERTRANWNDDRLDHFAGQVDKRFDRVEAHIDSRLDGIDARLAAMNGHLVGLHRTMVLSMTSIVVAFAGLIVTRF